MPVFKFKKLVRDNIWQWHEDCGHTVTGNRLSGIKLKQALLSKLLEEAAEVAVSVSKQELIEEIADVLQVIEDLCTAEAIDIDSVQREKEKKLEHKGGFTAGRYIDSVSMPEESDKWVQYCRQSPEKYPEKSAKSEVPSLERGIYRHNKSSHLYEVLGISLHTETNELLVVYRPIDKSDYEMFVRPVSMFNEKVEINGQLMPRFEFISS